MKKIITKFILTTLIFLPTTLVAKQNYPSVADLHKAVLEYSNIDLNLTKKWSKQARKAAWLPHLQVGTRHNLRDDFDLKLEDKVSVTSGGVVIGPRTSDFSEQSNRAFQFDVRAVWNLNELIFSPDSIFVSREARERRKEARVLLNDVNRWYFIWQRGGKDSQFAAAQLDAMSGGWFTDQLNRKEKK